jgi:hypothetical protein
LYIGISETVDNNLSAINSLVISKEKKATDFFCSNAALIIKLRESAVLPIAGRAARIISSHGLNQASISSNAGKVDITLPASNNSGLSTISIYLSTLSHNTSLI